MLYGEKTVFLKSRRVPESKKDEIEGKIDSLLLDYYNPKVVEIEYEGSDKSKPNDIELSKSAEVNIEEPSWKHGVDFKVEKLDLESGEEKIKTDEMADGRVISEPKWEQSLGKSESVKKAPFIPNSVKNKINMEALRDIASGKGVESELFSAKNKPIDEEYDCIVVDRGIPDVSERVYVSTKSQVAFYDRDDSTVFYVNLDGKYYRFVNSVEFKRFCKDNGIK